MLRTKYLTLAGCAVAALAFTGTMPAFAASSMCVDGVMVSSDDAMMEEEHMDDDAMADDSMMADDAMSDDAMAGDAMSDDAMADDAMSDDAMADDSMMADDGAMMEEDSMMADDGAMMEEDSMMAEGEMAQDDAMGADAMSADAMGHADMKGQYTVQTGDSLFAIAEAQLCDGDRYPELIEANSDVLAGVTTLQPGMVLTIPGD